MGMEKNLRAPSLPTKKTTKSKKVKNSNPNI
jgi:hypothetical protein